MIIGFSGHGYTDTEHNFYLLPSDSGREGEVTADALREFISSDELSNWLADTDAGQLVLIIDACHSAASVPKDFKPGPLGDHGLGQLAFDKGMQILAATQADNVALESNNLHQGLLTYALVNEGLEKREAAGPDGKITIKTWLQYAAQRVPELYDEVQAGHLRAVGNAKDAPSPLRGKDPTIDPIFRPEIAGQVQTPVLFDFYRGVDALLYQSK